MGWKSTCRSAIKTVGSGEWGVVHVKRTVGSGEWYLTVCGEVTVREWKWYGGATACTTRFLRAQVPIFRCLEASACCGSPRADRYGRRSAATQLGGVRSVEEGCGFGRGQHCGGVRAGDVQAVPPPSADRHGLRCRGGVFGETGW